MEIDVYQCGRVFDHVVSEVTGDNQKFLKDRLSHAMSECGGYGGCNGSVKNCQIRDRLNRLNQKSDVIKSE